MIQKFIMICIFHLKIFAIVQNGSSLFMKIIKLYFFGFFSGNGGEGH